MSLDDQSHKSQTKMRERLTHRPDDGVLLLIVKVLSVPFLLWHEHGLPWVLHWLDRPADRLLKASNRTYDRGRDDGPRYRVAVDLYMVIWGFLLCVIYSISWSLAASETCGAKFVIIITSAFAVARLYEIAAFTAALHSQAGYQPEAQIRAIINTIWHYCELVFAFSTLYIACFTLAGDQFVIPPSDTPPTVTERNLVSSYTSPPYFSFVTLTTLGYGDFSPQTAVGKMLVVFEVLFGFFLLVVVLQRAMSAGQLSNVEEVVEKLDEKCLVFIGVLGGADYFPAPTDERFSLGHIDQETFNHGVERLRELGLLRFDMSVDLANYAYHWTEHGKMVLGKLGIRRSDRSKI